jgi:tRNA (guanine37-N1)-methyltransferase
VKFYNPRDYTKDKHKKVDGIPYGGGPGMVMAVEPIVLATQDILKKIKKGKAQKTKIILTTPGGKQFTNTVAQKLEKSFDHIIIICGRYEGIDYRVKKILKADEYSIGDYVLTGGELPAMVMIDCISRQVESVLGAKDSLEESRVSSHEVYARPEIFEYSGKKYRVPKVLLSGHHKKIEEWKNRNKKNSPPQG